MQDAYVVAGTGSRSLAKESSKFDTVLLVTKDRLALIQALFGKVEVVSGMAEGFDELIAFAAIQLDIPFHACIPHSGYADYYWRRNSVTGSDRLDTFQFLLDRAASVEYVCYSIYVNGVHSNFIRNERMVELADEFIVYDPTSAGTSHCLKAIKRARLPFTVVGL